MKPSDKYALLVDKAAPEALHLRGGRDHRRMDVSTGLNNAKQPYNESPAGEYITVSKVSDFNAGSGTISRFAIPHQRRHAAPRGAARHGEGRHAHLYAV